MSITLAPPKEFGYVCAVGLSSVFVTLYQTMNVSKHRKASGIPYPYVYATAEQVAKNPAANRFNCAQRAHQNTLEVLPSFFVTLFLAGLRYPTASAAFGAIVMLGRIFYTRGYSSGDPKKRMQGSFEYIGRLGLLFSSAKVVYDMCTSNF